MSAKDFLKYVSANLKVEYVGERPVDPAILAANAKGIATQNATSAKTMGAGVFSQTVDVAAAIVRYKNGTFPMEGLLQATVLCGHQKFGATVPATTRCSAAVRYTHGPEAQFKDVVALATDNTIGAAAIPAWSNAWNAKQQRAGQQMVQAIAQQGAQQRAAQQQQFDQGQVMRQKEHDEFMATMRHGTDVSMQHAAQVANANHTGASDWVDYSLGQQTVRDPNTGQVSKVSASDSYTWVDASGKTAYQTNDPSANPNGTLQGTWTRQQVVHGDGSP